MSAYIRRLLSRWADSYKALRGRLQSRLALGLYPPTPKQLATLYESLRANCAVSISHGPYPKGLLGRRQVAFYPTHEVLVRALAVRR